MIEADPPDCRRFALDGELLAVIGHVGLLVMKDGVAATQALASVGPTLGERGTQSGLRAIRPCGAFSAAAGSGEARGCRRCCVHTWARSTHAPHASSRA